MAQSTQHCNCLHFPLCQIIINQWTSSKVEAICMHIDDDNMVTIKSNALNYKILKAIFMPDHRK